MRDDNDATHIQTTVGWVLRERFLRPLKINQAQLAHALGISGPRLNQVMSGRNGITTEMALRLGRALGTEPEFWLQMQMELDLLKTGERLRDELDQIQRIRPPAPHE